MINANAGKQCFLNMQFGHTNKQVLSITEFVRTIDNEMKYIVTYFLLEKDGF